MARQTVPGGAHEAAVEHSPLRVQLRGTHNKFTLSQPDPDVLRLLPSPVVRGLGWVFCALGWPVLLLGLVSVISLLVRLTLADAGAVLFLIFWGLPFAFFGVALLGPRYRFDRRSGELTVRHFGRTRHRPLADVVAVQVLNAGLVGPKYSEGGTTFVSYQLNLVVNDPAERRVFVAHNPDLADMETKAQRLAEFLHVPLLMAADHAPPARADEGHEPAAAARGRKDPTRHWAKTDEPLPPFDLAAGALGGFRLGDDLPGAEFLGR
ncbi:MAG TPA: hypothetical protein VGF55_12290, partial [Gemmataceae bacterium]